jgi:PhnB protein
MTLGATLYVRDSEGAAAFYCDAFKMAIGYSARNDDGTYLHAELERAGACIFAVSESRDEAIREAMKSARQPTMSLGVNLDDDAELRRAYELLKRGGQVIRPLGAVPWSPCSADVVDKYGVCWYLFVSQYRPED